MTLTDAGPLLALLDADEADHHRCVAALTDVTLPMLTTWPAFTEVMYLAGRSGGWPAQEALWRLTDREELVVAELSRKSMKRAAELMARYASRPMDLADATLVALAEERGIRSIFSLDSDFHIYRYRDRQRFEVFPL